MIVEIVFQGDIMNKKTMLQGFEWYITHEDEHWKSMTEKIKSLKEMGIDSIWLPPAFKGHSGNQDSGYGVYDLYDLGEFDQKGSVKTKYGSKDDYIKLIETMKEHKIDLIVDIVLNHRIGADGTENIMAHMVDAHNRYNILETKEIEAWTKFDFNGRNNQYSSFKWNHEHFKAVDFDVKENREAIYLFDGKKWDVDVDEELFNYDYLMGADVDFKNEAVQEELLRWIDWYYELTGFNGVRLDAVKHIDSYFFKEALRKLREKDKEIFAVGEYWSQDLKVLNGYLMDVDFSMQLFDVPLHHALERASKDENFNLKTLYHGTLSSTNPNYAMTFVDNHDTQIGQSLESWVLPWFKPHAYAFILLRDIGTPCVLYVDLYGNESMGIEKVNGLEKLISLRQNHMHGTFYDYMDEEKVIGWCYTGDDEGEGFVSLMNTGPRTIKRMFVGKRNANRTYVNIFDETQTVKTDNDGIGYFRVFEEQCAVYVNTGGNYATGILR